MSHESRWSRALVTGASSGIGRAAAHLLAADGTDLVLVARTRDVLESDAVSLRQDHDVDVEVLVADLTDRDQLATVEARLGDPRSPVDLLVNNAGFGTTGAYADLDVDGEEDEIRLNVLAVTRLAHAAATAMTTRGAGGILNVASLAALQPLPYNATYGATKAFVWSFGEALHEELRGTGVHASVLAPGFTRTAFQDTAEVDASAVPDVLWMAPEVVARAGLDAVADNRAVTVPGVVNRMVGTTGRSLPSFVTRKAVAAAMRWAQ